MGQICTDSSRSTMCLIGAAMLTLVMETMEKFMRILIKANLLNGMMNLMTYLLRILFVNTQLGNELKNADFRL